MKISLFQGVLYGVFGLAAIIGVFVFATHTGSNTGNKATAIGTVVVWGTLPSKDVKDALTAISQKDTNLKDVSYIEKNEATLQSDLATAIATGNAPDLVLASQEDLHSLTNFIVPIALATLPMATFTSTFVESGQIFTAPNGLGYYGLPFLVDPLVLFSNRSILSSDGIAKPPVTWESLTGLVPNVAILTNTKQIKRGLIALGTYDNVHNARGILSTLFLQTNVPISSYTNGMLVANLSGNTSGSTLPGQAVLNFYTQFADPSKVSYTWNPSLANSQHAFIAGDVALYLGYASESRFFVAANPNLNFVVSPAPQPATAATRRVYGLTYAFMIPRGAKNPSGAYQAAALLTNTAEQTIMAGATGLAPATLTPLATSPSDPVAAVAYVEALYTKGWLSPAPADTDAVFSSMIQGMITGRTAASQILTEAEQLLSAKLQ